MSGSAIAPLFNIGPTISGNVLGLPYQHYRPTTAFAPTSGSYYLGSLLCWMTSDMKGMGTKPEVYGKPVWFGFFDPTQTQPGDYLTGPLGTFFVASQDVPAPIQVVRCNDSASIVGPAPLTETGLQPGYGAEQAASEVTLARAWPCAMVQGTRPERGDANLPQDVKLPRYAVMLPAIPGVTITSNMVLLDRLGRRNILENTELTQLGWRLTAKLAVS